MTLPKVIIQHFNHYVDTLPRRSNTVVNQIVTSGSYMIRNVWFDYKGGTTYGKNDKHCQSAVRWWWWMDVIMPDPEHISATDEVSKTAVGSTLIMLIANPGGKEHTVKEYDALKRLGSSSRTFTYEIGHLAKKVVYSDSLAVAQI
ncbi:O-methyltransferase COMT-type, S-adenosyl-L-methionine-dependent methyltransferase [Artemisia annua]|uniref:O-methyltransferase COMT-type, S-adenosyl-L-methionine-dependent methyltransferase n=1 Tax=Artemisia annua TaxID=35608 RepID=A0A2U1PJS4_ARTAN|nr:O-methyltransferase COMT-type, S-adenosyl-L-methionine-dependent methyltransferase [Artemisia annua]